MSQVAHQARAYLSSCHEATRNNSILPGWDACPFSRSTPFEQLGGERQSGYHASTNHLICSAGEFEALIHVHVCLFATFFGPSINFFAGYIFHAVNFDYLHVLNTTAVYLESLGQRLQLRQEIFNLIKAS